MDSNKNRFSEIAEQQNISFGKTNTMHTVSADAVVALDFFFYPQFYLSKKSGDYLLSSSHFGAKCAKASTTKTIMTTQRKRIGEQQQL